MDKDESLGYGIALDLGYGMASVPSLTARLHSEQEIDLHCTATADTPAYTCTYRSRIITINILSTTFVTHISSYFEE